MKLITLPLLRRVVRNRALMKIARKIGWMKLLRCGVVVHSARDQSSLSMQIGGVEVAPLYTKRYLPPMEKWAARLFEGRFQVAVERDASRLLLRREGKTVALQSVSTFIDFLGGVLKHWTTIKVDQFDNISSIAGVTIDGRRAHLIYRDRRLEYEVAANWAEESLEEVLFWSDLLPNYYYKVGPPSRNGIVFDFGAFHGLFGLAAAIDVGPSGYVFCFEPDAQSLAALGTNIYRNNMTNIKVIAAGVGGRTEKLGFALQGDRGSHFSGKAEEVKNGVQVYSLPDCCKATGVSSPAFIKADVEGSELEMVESCLDWLAGLHSTIFSIASYHLVNSIATKFRLEHAFRKIGYHVATTRDGHQTTVAWRF